LGWSARPLVRCGGLPEIAGKPDSLEIDASTSRRLIACQLAARPISTPGDDPDASGGNRQHEQRGSGPVSDLCGDGVVGTSEECDDGNAKAGDGCSGVCLV